MEWNTPWRNPWNKIKQPFEPQRGGMNLSWGKPPPAVHPHAQRLNKDNEKERIVDSGIEKCRMIFVIVRGGMEK